MKSSCIQPAKALRSPVQAGEKLETPINMESSIATSLGARLLQKLGGDPSKNAALSPLSIAFALALATSGAGWAWC